MSAVGSGLTTAAALGAAAVGGVFFSFSTFTMQGLTRLPEPAGADAMRSINVTAVRPPFMALLFGTAAATAAAAVVDAGEEGSALRIAGAALYLVGTIGVTMVANVPLNNALEADPSRWREYARRWTRWNHVRTATSLAAGLAFLLS